MESILRNFMEKELRVQDVEDIFTERARIVGKPPSDGKPRPIIAKFSFFTKDKNYVLSIAPQRKKKFTREHIMSIVNKNNKNETSLAHRGKDEQVYISWSRI